MQESNSHMEDIDSLEHELLRITVDENKQLDMISKRVKP